MPLHIFLAQSLSLLTGGLDIWKIAKDVALLLLVLFTICLVWQQRRGSRLFNWFVALAAVYAAMHLLLWLLHPSLDRDSAILGIIYNDRLFGFLILGMGARLLWPGKLDNRLVIKVVLGISTLTAVIGVAQYFLPKDILTHLGYSLDRGVRPVFFIDDNPAFPRIMSTLRDPNSLGAYLIVPITTLTYLLLGTPKTVRRLQYGGLLLLHGLALYLTFSRSAWAGAALAIGFLLWWQFKTYAANILKRWWPVLACLVILAAAGLFMVRNSGVISHTTTAQAGQFTSNENHWQYIKKGLVGIWHDPFGHGPGTAGLVSIQNRTGGLLTENYYVQIGYEVGVLGLLIFIAVNILVCVYLWRCQNVWASILLASFLAYILINMLLHSWSNEAVAAQWWILAGLALATWQPPSKHAR